MSFDLGEGVVLDDGIVISRHRWIEFKVKHSQVPALWQQAEKQFSPLDQAARALNVARHSASWSVQRICKSPRDRVPHKEKQDWQAEPQFTRIFRMPIMAGENDCRLQVFQGAPQFQPGFSALINFRGNMRHCQVNAQFSKATNKCHASFFKLCDTSRRIIGDIYKERGTGVRACEDGNAVRSQSPCAEQYFSPMNVHDVKMKRTNFYRVSCCAIDVWWLRWARAQWQQANKKRNKWQNIPTFTSQ